MNDTVDRLSRTRVASFAKALAFVAGALGLQLAVGPIVGLAMGIGGFRQPPIWTFGVVYSALLLAATLVTRRIDRSSPPSVGLAPIRRRLLELLAGFSVGVVLFVILAVVRGASIDATWSFGGLRAAPAACAGLFVGLVLLLPEELLFRGYAFRQLAASLGTWPAILLSAALFGAYHTLASEMWAMGLFFQIAMPALGGVVFAWAAVRTGSLALPIGLHLAGNWVQSSLASLRPAMDTPPTAIWIAPLSASQIQSLLAPDLVTHLPYVATVLTAAVLIRLMPQPTAEACVRSVRASRPQSIS